MPSENLLLADGVGVVPSAGAESVLARAVLMEAWEDERHYALADPTPYTAPGSL